MINRSHLRFHHQRNYDRDTVEVIGSLRFEHCEHIAVSDDSPALRQDVEKRMENSVMQFVYGDVVKAVHELRQRVLHAIHVGGDHFDLMCKFDDLINMMK